MRNFPGIKATGSKIKIVLTAVFDAEKSLLDDLKQQNGQLRKSLAQAEKNEQTLIENLTKLSEENNAQLNQVGYQLSIL